jgi:DNA-binding NtrC family response regulator
MAFKVLYLDDEPVLCELFAELFSSAEVEVNVYTDARKAIDAARTSPPDIAVLDYRLEEMNGDRVAQLMPARIPKYLVTGDILVSPEYPFRGIFSKPGHLREIENLIEEGLKRKSAAPGTESSPNLQTTPGLGSPA